MISNDELKRMRGAAPLLPPPGGEVVTELITELERLRTGLSKLKEYGEVVTEDGEDHVVVWVKKSDVTALLEG